MRALLALGVMLSASHAWALEREATSDERAYFGTVLRTFVTELITELDRPTLACRVTVRRKPVTWPALHPEDLLPTEISVRITANGAALVGELSFAVICTPPGERDFDLVGDLSPAVMSDWGSPFTVLASGPHYRLLLVTAGPPGVARLGMATLTLGTNESSLVLADAALRVAPMCSASISGDAATMKKLNPNELQAALERAHAIAASPAAKKIAAATKPPPALARSRKMIWSQLLRSERAWHTPAALNEVVLRVPPNIQIFEKVANYFANGEAIIDASLAPNFATAITSAPEYGALDVPAKVTPYTDPPSTDADAYWRTFHLAHPNAGSIIDLSNVGFSDDHRQALVYFARSSGSLAGVGTLYLMQWTDTGWVIMFRVLLWIS